MEEVKKHNVEKKPEKPVEKEFSNETVFASHPDKVCDEISATLLMKFLAKDPATHAGIEVVGGKGKVFITGEVSSHAKVNIKKFAKQALKEAGYKNKYKIINNIGIQSPDINQGVSREDGEIGAGDQGIMYGYACNDTPEMLPTAMVILQRFSRCYNDLRKEDPDEFYPDGKAQITGIYDEDMKLKRIKTFVISYQNSEVNRDKTDSILKSIACDIAKEYNVEIEQFLINPTGKFLIGGFDGDAGLTGRKIVVDSYQGFANVGGGCMNGKDPSKVDISAAHMARILAKEILVAKKLRWAEVQLSYAIGVAEPVAIYINSSKGNITPPKAWYKRCKPANMISELDLIHANYVEWARYGHFTD